ncbi:MAG: hypothetical protein JWO06_1495 [Bacteroidota bacterium]|nr:hypothetical protein [Bacteroidota bacterium]
MADKQNNCGSELSCTLTTPELQTRKATVLESLRRQIAEQKELENGYAFKFAGTDTVLDEIISFVKTERQCCTFFTFNLLVKDDKNFIWLELTGPQSAKQFITTEMGLL